MEFVSRRICRACLKEVAAKGKLFFIYDTAKERTFFDTATDNAMIADILLSSIPGLLIELKDELPKSICLECRETLLKVADFQKLCLTSQKKMLSLKEAPQTSTRISWTNESIIKTEKMLQPETLGLQEKADINTLQNNESFIKGGLNEVSEIKTSQGAYATVKTERGYGILESNEECSENEIHDYGQSQTPIGGSSIEYLSSSHQRKDTEQMAVIKFEDESEEFTKPDISESTRFLKRNNETIEREHSPETEPATSKHVCTFCGKGFIKTKHIYQHIRLLHKYERTGENSAERDVQMCYECSVCPKKFEFPSKLHKHMMKMHAGIKPFACNACDAAFTSLKALDRHKEVHINAKPYQCNVCDKGFNLADNLRKHQRIHTGKSYYKCKYCLQTYVHRQSWILHLSKHLGENIYRCELCPQRFPMAKDAREHFASHKNEDKQTRLKNLAALKEDEAKLMENQKEDPLNKIESPNEMLAHILAPKIRMKGPRTKSENMLLPETSGIQEKSDKDEESEREISDGAPIEIKNEREYSEDVMHDSLGSMEDVVSQQQFDDTKESFVLKFEYESEELTTPDISYTIEEDDQGKDSATPVHVCKSCGKGYINPKNMLSHEKRCIKTGRERLYECPTCHRTFRKLSNLNYHKRKHTKPFACDECEAAFSRPGVLKKHKLGHIKSTTTSYECKYCDKSTMHGMKSHERTHTGERKYNCKFCMEAFTHYVQLIYHLRKHLGVNVYSCELCPQRFPLARDKRRHLASHKKEDRETRLRNMAALKEEEAKLLEKYKEDAKKEQPSKEKRFECDYCDKFFSSSWGLHRHELSHNRDTQDNKGRVYKCKYCDKAYTQKEAVALHIEKHHEELQE